MTVALALAASARRAAADDAYPSRVIKLVVPWPPGGITDVLGRILAQRMGAELNATMIVENRAGASGTIGHTLVAQAAPDGYTLLLATNSTYAMAPYLLGKLPYDSDKAFAPIGLVASSPQVLCVHPSVPVTDVKGFLAYVRARQPNGVSFESSGPGGSSHLAMELLMSMANVGMLHVPYRGGGPALQALVAGEVDAGFVDSVVALPMAATGQIRTLGVSSKERLAVAPDLPTIAEAGVPGFQSSTDVAMLAPAATPPAIIRKISAALIAALQSPQAREPMSKQGVIIVAGTPEEFPAYYTAESAKWGEIIRSRGISMK
ncbi:MAG TPA: tripartite tricarboxylate transporter substrate binding protein [Xanthobacteraceae bacterium]|nr:tripartite tricarboxylate transporter substrate binding protein [Xanthobacteraceae bacterium]